MKLTPLRADALLLFLALIWGMGFVPQQLAMAHVGPLTFTSLRFGLGALCVLPLLRIPGLGVPAPGNAAARAGISWPWRVGALAGLAVAGGAALQQAGLQHTTISSAGFITGLYVIFVPILGIAVQRPARPAHWLAALLAMLGLYLLSVSGPMGMSRGDLLVLASAVVWSGQILIIDRFAPHVDALRLAIVQFGFTAVVTGILAVFVEQPALASILAARWSILLSGVIAVGIAFTLQIVAQRAAPPAHAAILFSLEAVFAAIAGRVYLDEQLSGRQILGCAIIFAGILCSQLDRILVRTPAEELARSVDD